MQSIALSWVGTRTTAYSATVAFFRDGLGLRVGVERPDFLRFDLPDGGAFEVFRPEGPDDHAYFTTGPVVGFQVADFDQARPELARTGCELLGDPEGERGDYRWQHFRAPDGSVYEIVDYPTRAPDPSALGRAGVTGFGWVGVRTARFEAMRAFVGGPVGLRNVEEETDLVVFEFPNRDAWELFRPGGSSDHPHLTTGPMPGLVVRDLDLGESRLREYGVEILARRRRDDSGWVHFRAPDGYVYELKQFAGGHPRH
jgi:catechol 2,3-dioxygenase-like lactoylglutathione lyase family enzyme